MNFKPGIKARIYYTIVPLAIITIIAFSYLFRQITQRDELIRNVTENFQPSLTNLIGLQDKFEESRSLIYLWSLNTDHSENAFRDQFNNLFSNEIPYFRDALTSMTDQWVEEDYELLMKTTSLITDSLYFSYLSFISNVRELEPGPELTTEDIEFYMQDFGLIFILSEIEQNLNFLIDKRKLDITGIFNEISQKTTNLKRNIIVLSVFLLSFIGVLIFVLLGHLNRNISELRKNLSLLAEGKIPDPMEIKEKNEFAVVIENLNHLFNYLKNLTLVAKRIGDKDFSTEFKPLGEDDELGTEIVNLQKNLKNAHDEQIRYQEEEFQRKWVSDSIAKINDILRISTEKIEELGFLVIKALVEYTDARVGGLFILNNENPDNIFIEMIASYAYDRKKNIEKIIIPGEGLVGRCFSEKETIYMTDIPHDYLTIKSGLGENNPISILIAPLHLNENIFGVVELAAFSEFEDYKIRFVETIGENIATTISTLKTNLQTSILLDQTRQQAEELLAQEEEMRQNMEELRLIQENSAIKERELMEEIKELKNKIDSKNSSK